MVKVIVCVSLRHACDCNDIRDSYNASLHHQVMTNVEGRCMNVILPPVAVKMIRGEHFAPLRCLQVNSEFVSNKEIFQACAILLLCYLKDVIAE